MEVEKKKENCEIEKINLPDKICQASCSICKSDFLQEIHLLKKNGAKYAEIGVEIFKKSNGRENPTPSSLCNHFQNYNKIKTVASFQIMQGGLIDEATKRAAHSSAIVNLIDEYLELLKIRFDNGYLSANIPDLEKLMNIRYKLLSGEGDEDKDLTLIFKNAMNQCPTLFDKVSNEPRVVEVSKEQTEAELENETLQAEPLKAN